MNTTPPLDGGKNPADDKSPLELWAAYIPGAGKQRNYLSNGKKGKAKGIRLFKSKQAAHTYLDEQLDNGKLSLEVYLQIVIHSVEGKLALPEEADLPAKKLKLVKPPLLIPKGANIVPFDMQNLKPITTLAADMRPTTQELLRSMEKRRKRRRS